MNIEKEIIEIKKRNKKVEADKAWETCLTRKILILLFTYLALGLYMNVIGVFRPWLNAIIPSVGFLLSTLTLPYIKNFWLKYIYKKQACQ